MIGRLITAAALLLTVAASQPQSQAPPADTIFVNGVVLTVDARDSVAEAIAIRGGKIVAVGTSANIRKLAGAATETIDLHGQTLTPGLIDTHCHFNEAIDQLDLGVPEVKSIADVIAKVKAWADKTPAGEWIRGVGWDEGKLKERRYILASDLDKAAPNNPVYLTHTTGHYAVANTMAMKLSGVTKDTKASATGVIDRDKDGNPTGVFKESATGLIRPGRPSAGSGQVAGGAGGGGNAANTQRANVERIIAGFNREGMTGVKDLNINQGKWDLYKTLLDEGKLNVRVAALWQSGRSVDAADQLIARLKAQNIPQAPASVGDGRLVSAGVKLYIDGSGGARTAWMYEDWNKDWNDKDTGNTGLASTDPAVYREMVKHYTNAGLGIGTHSIGDRGIDWVVDSYEEALKAHPTKGLRHSIIHANTPTDHAIEVMARLQKTYDAGYPELQAPFMWWIGDTYAGNLGPERAKRLLPLKTLVAKGVMFSGGSDYNVTPYAARYGLWASVARQTFGAVYGATPFGTAEAIDIHTALKSYTIWGARQLFLEDRVGSIEVGKDADLAVWDKNMYKIPTDELKDLQCQLTMIAGKIVYRKP